MKISWSPLAVERLESIFNYIAEDNITAANKMVEKIFRKVESLTKYPLRGRIVPEANKQNIREVFVKEFRIIYRIESRRISILTIRNFKQLVPGKDLE